MFIDSRRSDIAWLDTMLGKYACRREVEEPVLEKDMLRCRIHTNARRIRGEVNEDLVVSQFRNGKQDLQFKRRRRRSAGDGTIDSEVIFEVVRVGSLKIELIIIERGLEVCEEQDGPICRPFPVTLAQRWF